MPAPRQKHALRLIHCHGCLVGVLLQFDNTCPRCYYVNTQDQRIEDDRCRTCGAFVVEYTRSAVAELDRRLAS